MSKARHGKSTFFVVMMSLLICGMLAIGATYAYGNYNSSRMNTTEPAETLAPDKDYAFDLQKWDGNDYVSLIKGEDGQAPAVAFGANTRWEPGRTQVVYLKIENKEAFDMDCRVVLDVLNSTFGDNLKYAVINDLQHNAENKPASWTAFLSEANKDGKGTSGTLAITDKDNLWNDNVLYEVKSLTNSPDKYFALAIHMEESATQLSDGNPMELSMEFKVKLDADYQPGITAAQIAQMNTGSAS